MERKAKNNVCTSTLFFYFLWQIAVIWGCLLVNFVVRGRFSHPILQMSIYLRKIFKKDLFINKLSEIVITECITLKTA